MTVKPKVKETATKAVKVTTAKSTTYAKGVKADAHVRINEALFLIMVELAVVPLAHGVIHGVTAVIS